MKIIVDGHGGHLCEAHLEGTTYFEVGETIEEAVGSLVRFHAEHFGVDIEILPCQTTAYERSGVQTTEHN
jgi:hypothetical protein